MGDPGRRSPQLLKVLRILVKDRQAEHYGLELARATGLASGTIYPILARLEHAGWLTSDWEKIDPTVEGRRPRRYYRLTAEGARAALVEICNASPEFGERGRTRQWREAPT